MTRRRRALMAVAAAALCAACGREGAEERDRDDRPGGEGAKAAPERNEDGRIVLGAEELRVAEIRTAPAAAGSVSSGFHAAGQVVLRDDGMAHVTARVAGAVREVARQAGDEVAVGSALAVLDSVEARDAQDELAAARAEAAFQERGAARMRQLYDKGLRSENELLAAQEELRRARQHLEALEGKVRALGADTAGAYVVRSPVAGTVLERHATVGQNVEATDELFLVGDLSRLWVVTSVYERDLAVVRRGMAAVVTVSAFPGVRLRGTVDHVGQLVDEKTRTVPLRVSVTNEPAPQGGDLLLRPGMFAEVALETARREGILVVPPAALQQVEGRDVVFVRAGGDGGGAAFAPRPVAVGARDADAVEIREGLKAGEEVVVENAYLLKSELDKARLPDED